MGSVRWGIVGTGTIANAFCKSLVAHSDAGIIRVCSRSVKRATEFAGQFAIENVSDSFEDLLQTNDVDVVYVATPNHLHFEQVKELICAGKNVLCEKPFTVDAEQAESLFSLAREKSVFCMEAMWMLCHPSIQKLIRLVRSGQLAKPKQLLVDFSVPFRPSGSNEFGGGVLLDRGVYAIALAETVMGETKTIELIEHKLENENVSRVVARLLTESGQETKFTVSFDSWGSNDAMLTGDGYSVQLHEPFYNPSLVTLDVGSKPSNNHLLTPSRRGLKRVHNKLLRQIVLRAKPKLESWTHSDGFPPYWYEIEHVHQMLRVGAAESDVVPAELTIRVLQIVDELHRQIQAKEFSDNELHTTLTAPR